MGLKPRKFAMLCTCNHIKQAFSLASDVFGSPILTAGNAEVTGILWHRVAASADCGASLLERKTSQRIWSGAGQWSGGFGNPAQVSVPAGSRADHLFISEAKTDPPPAVCIEMIKGNASGSVPLT